MPLVRTDDCPRRLRVLALAALLGAALAPSSALAATLDLQHEATTVTDVSVGGDAVVGPGDTVTIDERILSAGAETVTDLTGTLTANGSAATVTDAVSSYPNLRFGQSAINQTPFRAKIADDVVCGQNVGFSLDLASGGGGTARVPVTVPTGATAPAASFDAPGLPIQIADNATSQSTFEVTDPGRIKEARIRIGRITHPYVSDLQISLRAPDGTEVMLFEGRGTSGDNLVDTVFASNASRSIATATAPFTGTFRPEGDLDRLIGRSQLGMWVLTIRDVSPLDVGTLESWGGELAEADCSPRAFASFVAIPDQVAPGGSISFDASASRTPGTGGTHYEWDLDGNGTFETDTGTSSSVARTYPVRDTVVVGLRVSGAPGVEASATRTVAVTLAPTASFTASPQNAALNQTVTFDGSASADAEADGQIVGYEWDLDGNGSFETQGPTAQHSYAVQGEVLVRLRVTDDNGATATMGTTVTVSHRTPVAVLSAPTPAIIGTPATFDAGRSSDPNGQIIRYEWDLDGDTTDFELDTGAVSSVQRTFTSAGLYPVRVRVTDDEGRADTDQTQLRITARPIARLVVSPKPSRPNQVVSLDASQSSDDGALTFAFDLDGNGSYETSTGATSRVSRPFALGDHTVGVRVTDDAGVSDTITATVSAVNELPRAAITASANPATTGTPLSFSAAGSTDSDGTVVRYDWDLDGNGSFESSSASVREISYSYANAGNVNVRVRVRDNDGGTAIETLTLTVVPAPEPEPEPEPTPDGTGTGTDSGPGFGPATPPVAPPARDVSAGPDAGLGAGAGLAPGTNPAAPGAAPGGQASGPAAFLATLTGPQIQRIKLATRRGVRLACKSAQKATCKVTAQLPAAEVRRLGLSPKAKRSSRKLQPLTLATRTVVVSGSTDTAIVLRLPAKVRRALSRTRRAQLVVRGFATDGAGRKIALSRIVLLRR